MTTIKQYKEMIKELCARPEAEEILNDLATKAVRSYCHILCVTNPNNIAFVTFDIKSDKPIGIGFKSKAKKSDYKYIYEFLEAHF